MVKCHCRSCNLDFMKWFAKGFSDQGTMKCDFTSLSLVEHQLVVALIGVRPCRCMLHIVFGINFRIIGGLASNLVKRGALVYNITN